MSPEWGEASTKKPPCRMVLILVGAREFEPPTSCTPYKFLIFNELNASYKPIYSVFLAF